MKPSTRLKIIFIYLILVLLTPVAFSSEEHRGPDCDFRALNPSAMHDLDQYIQPLGRTLSEYEQVLLSPFGLDANTFVPDGGTVLDMGCGFGVALRTLAMQRHIHGILLNTQNFPELALAPELEQTNHPAAMIGSIETRIGWAEEILPTLPDNSVDGVLDFWGAWAWSPAKAFLIEEIYRVLKPGGRAAIFYPRHQVRAWVDDKVRGFAREDLSDWLNYNLPANIFDFQDIFWPTHSSDGRVLFLQRPLNGGTSIQLSLKHIKSVIPDVNHDEFLITHFEHSCESILNR